MLNRKLKNLLQVETFLLSKSNFTFIAVSFIGLILVITPFQILEYLFAIPVHNPVVADKSPLYKFLIGVIIAPLLETLLFQVAVIRISLSVRKNKLLAVTLSALLFSLTHIYSIFYVFYTFVIGLYLGYLYFLSVRKKTNPVIVIYSLHAGINVIAFMTSLEGVFTKG